MTHRVRKRQLHRVTMTVVASLIAAGGDPSKHQKPHDSDRLEPVQQPSDEPPHRDRQAEQPPHPEPGTQPADNPAHLHRQPEGAALPRPVLQPAHHGTQLHRQAEEAGEAQPGREPHQVPGGDRSQEVVESGPFSRGQGEPSV